MRIEALVFVCMIEPRKKSRQRLPVKKSKRHCSRAKLAIPASCQQPSSACLAPYAGWQQSAVLLLICPASPAAWHMLPPPSGAHQIPSPAPTGPRLGLLPTRLHLKQLDTRLHFRWQCAGPCLQQPANAVHHKSGCIMPNLVHLTSTVQRPHFCSSAGIAVGTHRE